MVWHGMVSYGMVWCDTVWYCMAWYGMISYGMVWCGAIQCGIVWYGMVWHGMVWCGIVWYGMVWCDTVWYCMVWYGWYGLITKYSMLSYLREAISFYWYEVSPSVNKAFHYTSLHGMIYIMPCVYSDMTY